MGLIIIPEMKTISYSNFKNDIVLRKSAPKGSVLYKKAVILERYSRPVPIYAI